VTRFIEPQLEGGTKIQDQLEVFLFAIIIILGLPASQIIQELEDLR
jgi:hypothetical protein